MKININFVIFFLLLINVFDCHAQLYTGMSGLINITVR